MMSRFYIMRGLLCKSELLLFILFIIGTSLITVIPYPVHAATAQQIADANAAANTYCLAKYPIEGTAPAPPNQNPVDANYSSRTTCAEWYAKELEAKYDGGAKPTTSQCSALGGSKVGVCKSAIVAASSAPKPGKAAPPHIPPAPVPSSSCNSSGGPCIDTSAVGIPQVSIGSGLSTVVTIFSFVAGVLSVIFLVIGGIRYSTSDGNSQNVTQARQTITFAIVGLAISILAPLIVDFVIARGPH